MISQYEPEICAALWFSVLNTVVIDLSRGTARYEPIERTDAERWVGDFPSGDFREVCRLAGINPDAAHSGFRKLIERERKKRRLQIEALEAAKKSKRRNSRNTPRINESSQNV